MPPRSPLLLPGLLLAPLLLPPLACPGAAQDRPTPDRSRQAVPPDAPARPSAAEARRTEVGRLLDALALAPDEGAAVPLEARLREVWAQGATPAVTLLLRAGGRSLQAGSFGAAAEDLDAAITLQPEHSESWILRAQAQAGLGDAAAAAADLREALRLEPRHFGALLTLATLQEERGDLSGALRSLEAALRLHPRVAGGEARLRDLRRRALGDDA